MTEAELMKTINQEAAKQGPGYQTRLAEQQNTYRQHIHRTLNQQHIIEPNIKQLAQTLGYEITLDLKKLP